MLHHVTTDTMATAYFCKKNLTEKWPNAQEDAVS